jgi:hypothetical protein
MVFFLLYNFIATLDTSFCCIDICKHRTVVFLGSKTLSDDDLLQVWGKHPEIVEGEPLLAKSFTIIHR